MAFMPQFAPVVVLMFLGTCGAMGLAGLIALYGFLRRKPVIWKWAIVSALIIVAGYATLLFVTSLASSERMLARGQKKYFCEIDCHITYSVEGARTANTLGESEPSLSQRKSAAGKFVIVRVKTLFDENTISPHRGNGPLTPNPRRVILADERGREYPASPEGQAALSAPLRPGESYFTDLVFDVPVNVRNPRLLITDHDPVLRAIIGHEASPLHKKIWFELGSPL